uniref:Trichome birefringence-like C-terminal domain-containing protein n=1 Tax=Oryza glaberrima TaxID=4538 RepID=I1PQZ6_ORYGL
VGPTCHPLSLLPPLFLPSLFLSLSLLSPSAGRGEHGLERRRAAAAAAVEADAAAARLEVRDSLLCGLYASLLCLLHRGAPGAGGSRSFETVDSLNIFRAKDYDATIELYWAPMLAESNSDGAAVLDDRLIRSAPMNKHSTFWKGADVLVFNSHR